MKFNVSATAPQKLASIIEVELADKSEVDATYALDPGFPTQILAQFATVTNTTEYGHRWMEKFGEWKHVDVVNDWKEGGKVTWEVDVIKPGKYLVDLTYSGEGRLVWRVEVEGGQAIQNQQNSSHNYQSFPMGWIQFPKAGRYKVSASCIDGTSENSLKKAGLKTIRFTALD